MPLKNWWINYQNVETNPAAESIERVAARMEQEAIDYYFITWNGCHIGAIRVVRLLRNQCRISPMCILPEFQGKGYAQQVLLSVEDLYPDTTLCELDTIKQEKGLCHLYEKMGYVRMRKKKTIKEGMDIVFYGKFATG